MCMWQKFGVIFAMENALGVFMKNKDVFNYISFMPICDAAKQHGVDSLLFH